MAVCEIGRMISMLFSALPGELHQVLGRLGIYDAPLCKRFMDLNNLAGRQLSFALLQNVLVFYRDRKIVFTISFFLVLEKYEAMSF